MISFSVGSVRVGRASGESEREINDQVRKDDYRTSSDLSARNSTFEGRVEARDGINFTQVTVLRDVRSSMGSLDASKSRLREVEVRDGARLVDTFASRVSVSMGRVVWTNIETGSPVEEIRARDGIRLKGVHCSGTVECSMGEITAERVLLSRVRARDGMVLVQSVAQEAEVSMGGLDIQHDNPDVAVFHRVAARDRMHLQGITVVDDVGCSMGKIKTENCRLNRVHARDGMILMNSPANHCDVSMGSLSVLGRGDKIIYQQLDAREDITLESAEVKRSVKSAFGKLIATDCTLAHVEVCKQATLTRTTAGLVSLKIPESERGVVTLQDSTIEGDLVVEVVKGGGVISFGGSGTSFGGMAISITGSTFNISVGDMSLLSMCAFGISEGSTGIVNGKPYRYEGGRFISMTPTVSASETPSKVVVEIRGNGIIKGSVVFSGGRGEVIVVGEATIEGSAKAEA